MRDKGTFISSGSAAILQQAASQGTSKGDDIVNLDLTKFRYPAPRKVHFTHAFASITSTAWRPSKRNELFSLASAMEQPQAGPTQQLVLDDTASSSTDVDSDMVEELSKLRCVVCKRSVLDDIERGHNVDYGPYELHVCDCCQRCFHNKCCRAKGIRPPPDTEELEEEAAVAALVKQAAAIEAAEQQQDGTQQHDPAQQEQQEQEQQQQAEEEQQRPWFHSSQCAQVAAGLAEKVAAGDTALDSSRSLQLIPSREGAVKPDVDALTDALEILLNEYGPRVASNFQASGYSVLLRVDGSPAAAAMLDVLGADVALLELLAVTPSERRQGHCSVMMRGLEEALGGVGTRKLLAVVQPEDVGSQHIFRHRFGYDDMPRRQLRALQQDFPHLKALEGQVLLVKDLQEGGGAEGQQRGQQQGSKRPWWLRAVAAPFSMVMGRGGGGQ